MRDGLTIGVDLDGVLYPFSEALRDYAVEHCGEDPETLSAAQDWDFFHTQWGWSKSKYKRIFHRGIKAGYIFGYETLPIPGSALGLQALREAGHRVILVTHRSVPGCEQECRDNTLLWLHEWDIPFDGLIFAGDKTGLGLDLLIDDAPHNIEAAVKAGERAWFWDQPWNRHVGHHRVQCWEDVLADIETIRYERPTIIGLAGYAQVGKDTLGAALVKLGFQRVSFADGVREALAAVNPIVGKTSEDIPIRVRDIVGAATSGPDWEAVKRITEGRELLQRLGTEMGRNLFGENVWVERGMAKCQPGASYVITDVRFPNEAEAIRKAGGVIVRIMRQGTEPANAHSSELLVDEIHPDLVFRNDGSLQDVALFAQHLADRVASEAA